MCLRSLLGGIPLLGRRKTFYCRVFCSRIACRKSLEWEGGREGMGYYEGNYEFVSTHAPSRAQRILPLTLLLLLPPHTPRAH